MERGSCTTRGRWAGVQGPTAQAATEARAPKEPTAPVPSTSPGNALGPGTQGIAVWPEPAILRAEWPQRCLAEGLSCLEEQQV